MPAATDWSLNPRVRKWVTGLPLPIKLPTVLLRGELGGHYLGERRAVLVRLRDAIDLALAEMLCSRGAALMVTDPQPNAELKLRILALGARFVAQAADLPSTIASASAHDDRRPLLLVARIVGTEPTDSSELWANLASSSAGEVLLQVGQALAAAPRHSRLCALVDEPPTATPRQTVLAAATAGLLRSLHKELGPVATTSHLLRLAHPDPQATAEVVGFLVSPAAAFVTGLDLVLGPNAGAQDHADGRLALVTGAARGIGAAIAQRLALSGCNVVVNDIPAAHQTGQATVDAIRASGGQAEFVGADCSTPDGAQTIAAAVARHGQLAAVVHNAGITRDRTMRKMTTAQWQQVLAVNLGAMELVQRAVDPWLQPGAGVALLSSVMGIAGNFGQCNYTAAKAGVLALMRLWAVQYRDRAIRCNAIAPGFIITDMTAQVPLFNREMAKQLTALLQPGLPADVAEVAAFLCHPASRALTGQTLRCDGGMAFGA